MQDAAEAIHAEGFDSHLRRTRQFRIHPGRDILPRHPESGSGRHRRRRRLLHSRLHGRYPFRRNRPRSTPPRSGRFGLRMYAKRSHAPAPRYIHETDIKISSSRITHTLPCMPTKGHSMKEANKIILYQDDDEITRVSVRFADEDLWLTQNQLADIYCTTQENISMHIRNIYADRELDENRTYKKFLLVRQEG